MPAIRSVLLAIIASLVGSAAWAINVGDAAPDFMFDKTWNAPPDKSRLSDYRGSVVLLECWATWCGPCKQMIPHMRELNSVYMPQGLNIISVSDEPAGTIEPFIKRNEMDYPVARAQGVTGLYGTDSIPYACLINAVGTVIWEGHPANLNSGVIQSALQATPVAPNTSSSTSGESNWWVWFILGAGVLFAGAVGWFVWSTRDKTPRQVQMDWQPQPQQGPPQQPGAPPPGGYGSPPPGNYGGPAPQQPGQGYLAGPAQPQAGQGYLNDGAPQTLGYNAPPPTPGTGMHPGVGGGNSYAGGERLTDNTEFLEPRKDAPFLGGNPDDEEFPPFDTNQNRPGNPYR